MGVTVIKDRPKAGTKVKGKEVNELVSIVDTLGGLEADLATLQAEPVFAKAREIAERIDDLKGELRARCDATLSPEQSVELPGESYVATVGKKANKRSITDVRAIAKFMGRDFFKIVSVALKDVDDYLNPEQREQCISSDRTGTRSVKVKVK